MSFLNFEKFLSVKNINSKFLNFFMSEMFTANFSKITLSTSFSKKMTKSESTQEMLKG